MNNIVLREENIVSKIFLIRNKRVMLDSDLAQIYQVETKMLNRAVKRNMKRFPDDFMFQLNSQEWKDLKCQNGTSTWGGRRTFPYAFTEHGAIMLATVLNSQRAIDASILVVRAFTNMKEFILMSKEITKKLEQFEASTIKKFGEHDKLFQVVFDTLQKVLLQETKTKKPIGFITD